MKGFSEYGRAVVTGNGQKPMEKHDFSQWDVTQPPTHLPHAAVVGRPDNGA